MTLKGLKSKLLQRLVCRPLAVVQTLVRDPTPQFAPVLLFICFQEVL